MESVAEPAAGPGVLEIPRQYGSFGPRRRFSNGGIAAGLIAARLGGTVVVRLREPVPVAVPLDVTPSNHGVLEVRLGDRPLADAGPADLEITPPPVRLAEAMAASDSYESLRAQHPGPGCFICGPRRRDGLRLFAGRLPGQPAGKFVAAAPWSPTPTIPGEQIVRPEIVWGALECSSAVPFWEPGEVPLAYRIVVNAPEPVLVGEPLVVVAWLLSSSGRKRTAASAIQTADGRVLATGRVDWVVRDAWPGGPS